MKQERGPEQTHATWAREFRQEADGNSSDPQYLMVKQDDCGGGEYYVIETERWAFDSLAELVAVVEQAGVPPLAHSARAEALLREIVTAYFFAGHDDVNHLHPFVDEARRLLGIELPSE